ncbi:hypothetical protein ACFQ07_25615 [Actinomadura adrarensis]|uniref:Uncharacterized protein n=1 Tax=Actinomadura adrarensis TaxID=1819600 RepID=A0ABW3CP11_9ACTN
MDHLRGALRSHNKYSVPEAQIRLRIALNAGSIESDAHGLVGHVVNHAARLVDAPAFKQELNRSSAPLGLVVSDRFFDEEIKENSGPVDPDDFRRIEIDVKEFHGFGRLHIPGPVGPAPQDAPNEVGDDSVFVGRWEHTEGSPDATLVAVFELRPDKTFTFWVIRGKDTWKTIKYRALGEGMRGEWRVAWADPSRPVIKVSVTRMGNPIAGFLTSTGRLLQSLRFGEESLGDNGFSYGVVRLSRDVIELESGTGAEATKAVWRRLA